jgi:hypothetical protein
MGDDGGQLLGRDLARDIAVVEPPGDEDAPVGGGQAIDRIDLEHMDAEIGQVDFGRHASGQLAQPGIGQLGRLPVELAVRPPGREHIHAEGVEDGDEDRRQLEHGTDMGGRPVPGKGAALPPAPAPRGPGGLEGLDGLGGLPPGGIALPRDAARWAGPPAPALAGPGAAAGADGCAAPVARVRCVFGEQ